MKKNLGTDALLFMENVANFYITPLIIQSGYLKYADEKTQRDLLRAMDFKDLDDFRSFLGQAIDIGNISDLDYSLVVEKSIKELLADTARIKKVPYHVDRDVLESIACD